MSASTSEADQSGRIAFRSATLAITLLLCFTPLRPLAILGISLVAVVLLLKFAYSANRGLGISLIALVALALTYYLFLQYSGDKKYQRLLAELSEYDDVSIRRELFPFPKIPQLSIGYGVSDAELSDILELNGLTEITELYLDSDELTDASLATVAAKFNLKYVFIDCEKVTNAAILDFEKQFPDCTVIPYDRDLHDDGIDVYLGPPADGE